MTALPFCLPFRSRGPTACTDVGAWLVSIRAGPFSFFLVAIGWRFRVAIPSVTKLGRACLQVP